MHDEGDEDQELSSLLSAGEDDRAAAGEKAPCPQELARRRKATGSLGLLVGASACALLARGSSPTSAGMSHGAIRADEEHVQRDDEAVKHLRRHAADRELALKEKEWDSVAATFPRSADEVDLMGGGGDIEPITAIADDDPTDVGCSDIGEDCSKTHCCNDEGLQCYQKSEWWAACLPKCSTVDGEWTCKKLGERAPLADPGACSVPGDNCATTRCCSEAGMQCYAMDDWATWSTCAYVCQPGVGWSANWTCEELGERAPDPLECSWTGEACIHNRLCCHEGQQCVRKNALEAYCSHEAPDDEGWDGEVLGGSRNEWEVQTVAPEEARGTSLFCFMAVLPGSAEEQLRDLAASKQASIFACEESASFSSWQVEFVTEGTWQSVVNTDVFKSIWEQVKQDGRYQQHDWTVKVDADSVFFPDRLRAHLGGMGAPKEVPIYIKNVNIDFGFLGAIEVLSKEAVDKMFWDGVLDKCEKEIGDHAGEDGFLKGCLDMVGAGFIEDDDVLRTPAAYSCTDGSRVCFHAFKDVGGWERCFNEAR